MLREFHGYGLKRYDVSYVSGITMSMVRLAAWVAAVVCCLVEKQNCVGHRNKTYAKTCGRRAETEPKKLTWNVREYAKHRSCEEIRLEQHWLCSA